MAEKNIKKKNFSIAMLIPCYDPPPKVFEEFIEQLVMRFNTIYLIDDGSATPIISRISTRIANAVNIIRLDRNYGKNTAVKRGMEYIQSNIDVKGVIVADADGQHLVGDLERLSEVANEDLSTPVFCERKFREATSVPVRSMVGNAIIGSVINRTLKLPINDTQCGLRYIPNLYFSLVSEQDLRYGLELDFAINYFKTNREFRTLSIKAEYIGNNQSSKFRPCFDSLLVTSVLVKHLGNSAFAALVDITAFTILLFLYADNALTVALVSRIASGGVNFILNRRNFMANGFTYVHSSYYQILGYIGLTLLNATFSALISSLLFSQTAMIVLGKIIIDGVLFLLNFQIQQKTIFSIKKT